METHLHDLCAELGRSCGIDVEVLVANNSWHTSSQQVSGTKVTRLATPLIVASTPICLGMISAIRRSDVDIVHLHHPNPAAFGAYAMSGHPGKLVVTYHSDILRQKYLSVVFHPVLHSALLRASAILVTSPNYLISSSTLQRHTGRCHVVPLGISVDQFAAAPSKVAAIRARYGSRLVLAVGRLIYYKGFDRLIRAMCGVDGRLLLIGEGPLRSQLQAESRRLGVEDRVVFLGHVDVVAPYYHAADVFVLPAVARTEAFGIVQLEAMACGKPVVNTSLDSGVPFVSQHNVTGLTVPPGDVDALAGALNCLLADQQLRSKYGSMAKLRVEQEFTLKRMAARTSAVYRSVLGSSAVAGDQSGVTTRESVAMPAR